MKYEIEYGKAGVSVFRTRAAPLRDLATIPESPFRGRDNTLFGAEIEVMVRGESFLEAYTSGDNRRVVATDTMKNFICEQALLCNAATLEGWLEQIGRAFLDEYPHMERLTMVGRELPFSAGLVAADGGFGLSDRVFSREHGARSTARIDLERTEEGRVRATALQSAREGLKLIKLTGSAFADFARDEHTTLPERTDRPLYIWCDIRWAYADLGDALRGSDRYVAGEQVGDLATAVFDDFVSLSIQHLVHQIGLRILDRFPQLSEVSFEAQNRLWDTAAVADGDDRVRVYVEPRPPFGRIGLVMRR